VKSPKTVTTAHRPKEGLVRHSARLYPPRRTAAGENLSGFRRDPRPDSSRTDRRVGDGSAPSTRLGLGPVDGVRVGLVTFVRCSSRGDYRHYAWRLLFAALDDSGLQESELAESAGIKLVERCQRRILPTL